ncbi:unnamed protein product [Notodromas monacha]|uniref:TFIIF beta subunit HTH domain-containing protein n=1 Tax=Notodromas monacha TaxID=399045 RepID=A0A7R9BDW8_9CRUS|nr:unnamed protein product [Notodromas monacha]CAG0912451.1 unnamed protein product [Notodromas monacha]
MTTTAAAVWKTTTTITRATTVGGNSTTTRLQLEGKVVQRAECRPVADLAYMRHKAQMIRDSSKPTRTVIQLEKAIQNYKPVADHRHNIEFEKLKKAEGKKARGERDKVLESLFAAFEKHQYYNIKDLCTITQQPITYLKELLKERRKVPFVLSFNEWMNLSVCASSTRDLPPLSDVTDLSPEQTAYVRQLEARFRHRYDAAKDSDFGAFRIDEPVVMHPWTPSAGRGSGGGGGGGRGRGRRY